MAMSCGSAQRECRHFDRPLGPGDDGLHGQRQDHRSCRHVRPSSHTPIHALSSLSLEVSTHNQHTTRRICLLLSRFGTSIHLKLYPIIYSLALSLHLGRRSEGHGSDQGSRSSKDVFQSVWRRLLNIRTLGFLTVSALTFALLTAGLYALYGWEFLYETYLYHLVRRDNRHNFSM